ncbi:MAG: PQQ-binding-like beta-propeller repeat protein [Acidobacteriota bacterium]
MRLKIVFFPIFLTPISCSLLNINNVNENKIFSPFPLDVSSEIELNASIKDNLIKMNSKIIFFSGDEDVYCLNPLNGKIDWKFHLPFKFLSKLSFDKNFIYLIDHRNIVYKLDKDSGKIVQIKNIEINKIVRFDVDQNLMFALTEKNEILCFDLSKNKRIWSTKILSRGVSGPFLNSNNIYLSGEDNSFYSISKNTGKNSWKIKFSERIEGEPAFDRNNIYFGSNDDYFYSIRKKNGSIKWRVRTGGDIKLKPLIDKKYVYFVSMDKFLYCVKKSGGNLIWWKKLPARTYSFLDDLENFIIISTQKGNVLCFNKFTGNLSGEFSTGIENVSNPLWIDPFIIVAKNEGGTGKILLLQKLRSVSLKPDKAPPQDIGELISISAETVGFIKPVYKFTIFKNGKKFLETDEITESKINWIPKEEGEYIIKIKVKEEQKIKETEISYSIINSKKEELRRNLLWDKNCYKHR